MSSNNKIDDKHFQDLLNKWIINGHSNKYYFIVTKCCGYEFLIPIYKSQTMSELFYNIGLEHSTSNEIILYKKHIDMQDNTNPIIANNIVISEWIIQNRDLLECTTKVPNPVAFRLWLKDSCDCNHNSISKQ